MVVRWHRGHRMQCIAYYYTSIYTGFFCQRTARADNRILSEGCDIFDLISQASRYGSFCLHFLFVCVFDCNAALCSRTRSREWNRFIYDDLMKFVSHVRFVVCSAQIVIISIVSRDTRNQSWPEFNLWFPLPAVCCRRRMWLSTPMRTGHPAWFMLFYVFMTSRALPSMADGFFSCCFFVVLGLGWWLATSPAVRVHACHSVWKDIVLRISGLHQPSNWICRQNLLCGMIWCVR